MLELDWRRRWGNDVAVFFCGTGELYGRICDFPVVEVGELYGRVGGMYGRVGEMYGRIGEMYGRI